MTTKVQRPVPPEGLDRYQRYHLEHRKRIARKRRKRYLEDAKYRREQRRRAREWCANNRTARRMPGKARARELWITVVIDDELRQVRVYTIGQMARLLGFAKQTLVLWEGQGVHPPPTYRTPANWRLYTEAQVELLRAAVAACGRRDRHRIHERVAAHWHDPPQGVREVA